MTATTASADWTQHFAASTLPYPAEYVIRIFKGAYPRLNLSTEDFSNKKILDLGCGSGRHLPFLQQCGFKPYGVEISSELVRKIKNNVRFAIDTPEVHEGFNHKTPFTDAFFDYLLSWNACYYMPPDQSFDAYLKEFARILKPGGKLILSVPKKSCFIFQGATPLTQGYCRIENDPFLFRNGTTMRVFEDRQELIDTFSPYFEKFAYGSVEDDCFGMDYHWHLLVADKKSR